MLIEETRGVEESYTSAMTTSNMRVEADVRGDADVIIAAGMNKSRLGGALLRLRTEFDRAERPKAPAAEQIQALANTMLIEVPFLDKKGQPSKRLVPDVRAASKEAWRWYGQELHAFMGKLKSMSSVSAEMGRIAKAEGADATVHPPCIPRANKFS